MMTQAWNHLLFAHWLIAPEVLRPLLPAAFPLDRFDGQCWVSITPFYITHACLRGMPPLPYLSQSPEINVRTYVIVENIPGVYFLSLDAGNPLAVWLVRMLLHLPYYPARIRIHQKGDDFHYFSQRTHSYVGSGIFSARYHPISSIYQARSGTLDYWLIERYCLYTEAEQCRILRVPIHHKPWLLQRAHAEIMHNSLASADGLHLSDTPPLLHYAPRQEVLVWPSRRVSEEDEKSNLKVRSHD